TFENQNYITVFELPAVEFTAMENQCIDWPGFELSEGSPAGGVYSGPGVESGWFYPDVAGMGTHTLTYTYLDGNGCENAANQDILVDACTGIGILSGAQSLRVYPNPVTSLSTIEYYVFSDIDVNISIFNSLGMLVKEIVPENANMGRHEVNVRTSDFENGIYFVKLTAGEQTATTKMTIVK
ncbi:MAG: T9SS type A sorting domain-containing protein, partial [Bacteroidales bacterium]|nr:T9SS type A sorting domain-containing protein [Bacteroidales bacterium]